MELNLNPDTHYRENMPVKQRRLPENAELRLAIDNLVKSAETIDVRRLKHQQHVTHLCCAIGEKFGLNQDVLKGLSISASLHDLGLLRVPEEILGKPGTLTAEEVFLIKQHPQTGYQFLQQVDFPWPVAEIVLQHHEHFDGSGYPSGLVGNQIRIEARMICVADAVEAITSNSPHRPAGTVLEATEELKKGSGSLYDPDVVEAFLQLVHGRILQAKGWAEKMQ